MFERFCELAWLHAWQLSVLIVVVGLVSRLIEKRAPQLASCLWAVVLLKAFTPPVVALPSGVFCWSQLAITGPSAGALPASSAFDDGAVWRLWAMAAVLVWLSGVVVTAAVCLLRGLRLRRDIAEGLAPDDHPLAIQLAEVAAELGMARPPRLVISPRGLGPAVCGLTRSTVVFPAALVPESGSATVRAILLHELLHVRRGDTVVAILQMLARVVWWFHPLVWWAMRKANEVTERCVDRGVTQLLGDRCEPYARGLLRVLELRAELTHPTGLPGICSARLSRERVTDIYATPRRGTLAQRAAWAVSRIAVAAVFAAAVLPGGAVTPIRIDCSAPTLTASAGQTEAAAATQTAKPIKTASSKSEAPQR
ncbi:MAG: M56 family metallopeptidase [Planctomycetota bacterium]